MIGVDVLNNAMDNVYTRALPEKWVYVNVSVAPSTITITEYGVTTTENFNVNSSSSICDGQETHTYIHILYSSDNIYTSQREAEPRAFRGYICQFSARCHYL